MPMLPTMPKETAITLCTAPMRLAQPKMGITDAPTTRNSRENAVPMPPGMCSASVTRFATGAAKRLENSPISQHNAKKIRCFS